MSEHDQELAWILAQLEQGKSLAEVVGQLLDADPWWTPERRADARRHFERTCPDLAEKDERYARHWHPLVYYRQHGIEPGLQWDMLGQLAARYARDFTVGQLADQLWAVMEASDQDPRDPWRRKHAYSIAARAHEFIERADLEEDSRMKGLMAWAAYWTTMAQREARRDRFGRWARREALRGLR